MNDYRHEVLIACGTILVLAAGCGLMSASEGAAAGTMGFMMVLVAVVTDKKENKNV